MNFTIEIPVPPSQRLQHEETKQCPHSGDAGLPQSSLAFIQLCFLDEQSMDFFQYTSCNLINFLIRKTKTRFSLFTAPSVNLQFFLMRKIKVDTLT